MKYEINSKYNFLQPFVVGIERFFSYSGSSIFKARNQIKVFEEENEVLAVKSYAVPFFLKGLIYGWFRKSKAYRAYHFGLRMLDIGIPTPEPVAYVENRKCGILRSSYFLSLQCDYPHMMWYLYDYSDNLPNGLLPSFVNFTVQMHTKGVYHPDYSPGNILFEEKEGQYHFALVDTNRVQFKEVSVKEGCENFKKLWTTDTVLTEIATLYATERKANIEQCITWLLEAHRVFFKKVKPLI